MFRRSLPLLLAALAPLHSIRQTTPALDGPTYAPSGQLKRPENYREWIFLGSGLDMSYNKEAAAPEPLHLQQRLG